MKPKFKVKIEPGIPIPEKPFRKRRSRNIGFDLMKVGDSFPLPKERVDNIRTSMYHYEKRNKPKKFKCLRVSDDEYRIWRTK